MPDLDLGPDDYAVQTKRGNWVRRDDFRLVLFVGVPMLAFWFGFAWWNRAEISLVLLFTLVAMAAFGIGLFAGAWLKRFD